MAKATRTSANKKRYTRRETYAAVEAYKAKGLAQMKAIHQVAKDRGAKSHHGVQSAYYAYTRIDLDGKGSKKASAKPRTGAVGKKQSVSSTSKLLAEAKSVIERLATHVEALEVEAASLRHKASEYDKIASTFSKR